MLTRAGNKGREAGLAEDANDLETPGSGEGGSLLLSSALRSRGLLSSMWSDALIFEGRKISEFPSEISQC